MWLQSLVFQKWHLSCQEMNKHSMNQKHGSVADEYRRVTQVVACVRVADGIEDALSPIAVMDIEVDDRHAPDILALRMPTTDA